MDEGKSGALIGFLFVVTQVGVSVLHFRSALLEDINSIVLPFCTTLTFLGPLSFLVILYTINGSDLLLLSISFVS